MGKSSKKTPEDFGTPPPATKVGIYVRVSTDEQSYESQEREVLEFCRRRDWQNPTVFRDTASGANTTRPGLEKLLRAVRAGDVSTVVTYKLDRIGRSLTHLAIILEEFSNNNVSLICTSQGIDTSANNPVGKLQLGVLMAVAEFERSMIRERTKAGLKAAQARGVQLGRPPTSSEIINSVLAARDRLGPKVRAIARELGIPPTSVHRILKQHE